MQLTVRHRADQCQGVADLSRLPDRNIVTHQVLGVEMPHWVGDADDLDQLGLLLNGRKHHGQRITDQDAAHQRRADLATAKIRRPEKGPAEILARALRERGPDVEVDYLHVHLPRVSNKAPS
ncbi:hypothetical protein [Streptomyces acidicola]|uniref:hypothetical protein n=1 Tax=Streptomyces acidicola TaxID=2596892 RepID=UPI00380720EC